MLMAADMPAVGFSLQYNIKHLQVILVAIWFYINKIKYNSELAKAIIHWHVN